MVTWVEAFYRILNNTLFPIRPLQSRAEPYIRQTWDLMNRTTANTRQFVVDAGERITILAYVLSSVLLPESHHVFHIDCLCPKLSCLCFHLVSLMQSSQPRRPTRRWLVTPSTLPCAPLIPHSLRHRFYRSIAAAPNTGHTDRGPAPARRWSHRRLCYGPHWSRALAPPHGPCGARLNRADKFSTPFMHFPHSYQIPMSTFHESYGCRVSLLALSFIVLFPCS